MEELIAVVDDSDVQIEVIGEYLKRAGYTNVLCFSAPSAALQHLADTKAPLLIITDYEMPKMNGVEMLARFKARRQAFHAIIITGNVLSKHSADHHPVIQKGTADFFPRLLSHVRECLALSAK